LRESRLTHIGAELLNVEERPAIIC
jgi:hypothetical protein